MQTNQNPASHFATFATLEIIETSRHGIASKLTTLGWMMILNTSNEKGETHKPLKKYQVVHNKSNMHLSKSHFDRVWKPLFTDRYIQKGGELNNK